MSLIQDLRAGGISAVAVDPEGDKVIRMSAVSARIEAGAVILPRHAPWLDEFRTEMLAFPNGRHDDQVDALSQGLARAFRPPTRAHVKFIRGCC
jgi:predicted phage terminase large subunit-like protein